jgi:hypothetical protein
MDFRPTRCVEGRLMRSDPQPDDPNLETDRGVCPECQGRGCELPKAQGVERGAVSREIGPRSNETHAVVVWFDKRLTDEELRDFEVYCGEWEP